MLTLNCTIETWLKCPQFFNQTPIVSQDDAQDVRRQRIKSTGRIKLQDRTEEIGSRKNVETTEKEDKDKGDNGWYKRRSKKVQRTLEDIQWKDIKNRRKNRVYKVERRKKAKTNKLMENFYLTLKFIFLSIKSSNLIKTHIHKLLILLRSIQ